MKERSMGSGYDFVDYDYVLHWLLRMLSDIEDVICLCFLSSFLESNGRLECKRIYLYNPGMN